MSTGSRLPSRYCRIISTFSELVWASDMSGSFDAHALQAMPTRNLCIWFAFLMRVDRKVCCGFFSTNGSKCGLKAIQLDQINAFCRTALIPLSSISWRISSPLRITSELSYQLLNLLRNPLNGSFWNRGAPLSDGFVSALGDYVGLHIAALCLS